MNASRARGLVLAVTAVLALSGMLGSLGALGWWLELFSHFRLQYAVLLLLAAMALVALRLPAAGFAALALAVLNSLPLAHYYLPRPVPAAGDVALRAIALNLFAVNRQHQRVIDYVRGVSPDLVVFSEASGRWRQALTGLRDEFPHQAWAGDVMVVSKWPLASLRPLGEVNDEPWALVFTVETGNAAVTVVGGHAHWPLGAAASAARNRELAMLASLSQVVTGPFVVLGDLNITAFSPAFRDMLAASRLLDCAAGRGLVPTWPARVPPFFLQIDHCLHGPGIDVASLAGGPYVGSDHYPLEVEFRLPAPAGGDTLTAWRAAPTSRR